MGLFDFLKRKKYPDLSTSSYLIDTEAYFKTNLSEYDLLDLIEMSIVIFEQNPGAGTKQLLTLIEAACEDKELAYALYCMIPIAFCRQFLPEPTYSDEYIIYKSDSDEISYLFSESRIYRTVQAVAEARFKMTEITAILFHSADFKAINDALKNGSKLEDLMTSPSYIVI